MPKGGFNEYNDPRFVFRMPLHFVDTDLAETHRSDRVGMAGRNRATVGFLYPVRCGILHGNIRFFQSNVRFSAKGKIPIIQDERQMMIVSRIFVTG